MTTDVTLALDAKATLGEGPIWDAHANVLWWIDIKECKLHRFDPADGSNQTYPIDQMIGTVVPRASAGLVLALEKGFAAFDPETGRLEMLQDPESGRDDNRFNDGKCDPAGRFWAGTMSKAEDANQGSLYCLHADGRCEKKLGEISVANGIVWTADKTTMYYIDSPTRRIDAFDFNIDTGDISHRRTVVAVPEGMGYPDGMSIDSEDNLWVGMWAGWAVIQFNPRDGGILSKLEIPSANVTACAFGGPELKDLYITTASDRAGDLAQQPNAGGLFHARPGVAGVPAFAYAG